jgi:hypothetical protein
MKHNARMGLINRIFKGKDKDAGAAGPASSQFYESEPGDPDSDPGHGASRNAPRRELVQVVLRDTMRKHGIPSDWVECRVLSTISRSGRAGLHVNFVVRRAHDQLLGYVFAFQHSFERELARFDPRARDWLLSLGWEFQDFKVDEMPDPKTFAASGPAPLAELKEQRTAMAFEPTQDPNEDEPPKSEEEVEADLKALFAIRDAALADTAAGTPRPPGHGEFQPTQPFPDSKAPKPS